MPYTLSMFFLWGVGMALIGVVLGWLLRSLRGGGRSDRSGARDADRQELDRLRRRVADLELIAHERDRLRMELADIRGSSAGEVGFPPSPPDLEAARATLGRDVDLDDLTVVEGIGPKIVELCAGIGVTTWRQLAETEPSMLKTMLVDGGSQFTTRDPTSWPRQAELLADGRWDEYKALVDELGADR